MGPIVLIARCKVPFIFEIVIEDSGTDAYLRKAVSSAIRQPAFAWNDPIQLVNVCSLFYRVLKSRRYRQPQRCNASCPSGSSQIVDVHRVGDVLRIGAGGRLSSLPILESANLSVGHVNSPF